MEMGKVNPDEFAYISDMTDNEVMTERETRRQIEDRSSVLDTFLAQWKDSRDKILTTSQIDCLRYLAEHNLRGTSLTHNQAEMKSQIHQALRDGFRDIDRMISFGFMSRASRWNPASIHWKKRDVEPFDPDKIWKKDFPLERVKNLVHCLVSLYGDEYAYGLIKAIEEGLQSRIENSEYEVQVRLTKYVRGPSFGVR